MNNLRKILIAIISFSLTACASNLSFYSQKSFVDQTCLLSPLTGFFFIATNDLAVDKKHPNIIGDVILKPYEILHISSSSEDEFQPNSIHLAIESEAARKLYSITSINVGQQMAFLIDGEMVYDAIIMAPLSNSFSFTTSRIVEATKIYNTLMALKNSCQ